MARLTISEAARVAGVARSTLHRAIKQGRLSLDPDGRLDTAELLRVGYTLQGVAHQERSRSIQPATPQRPEALQPTVPVSNLVLDALTRERDLLQRQLEATQDLLQSERQAALERERAARDREALLLQMLQETQHRYDRLLEAPRAIPPTQASRAATVRGDPHAMRRRILNVLAEHPQGLHHTGIAQALGVESSLGPTLRSMLRDRLVRRVGMGAYAVAEDEA